MDIVIASKCKRILKYSSIIVTLDIMNFLLRIQLLLCSGADNWGVKK